MKLKNKPKRSCRVVGVRKSARVLSRISGGVKMDPRVATDVHDGASVSDVQGDSQGDVQGDVECDVLDDGGGYTPFDNDLEALGKTFGKPVLDVHRNSSDFNICYESLANNLQNVKYHAKCDFDRAQMKLNYDLISHATQHVNLNKSLAEVLCAVDAIKLSNDLNIKTLGQETRLSIKDCSKYVDRVFDLVKKLSSEFMELKSEYNDLAKNLYHFQVRSDDMRPQQTRCDNSDTKCDKYVTGDGDEWKETSERSSSNQGVPMSLDNESKYNINLIQKRKEKLSNLEKQIKFPIVCLKNGSCDVLNAVKNLKGHLKLVFRKGCDFGRNFEMLENSLNVVNLCVNHQVLAQRMLLSELSEGEVLTYIESIDSKSHFTYEYLKSLIMSQFCFNISKPECIAYISKMKMQPNESISHFISKILNIANSAKLEGCEETSYDFHSPADNRYKNETLSLAIPSGLSKAILSKISYHDQPCTVAQWITTVQKIEQFEFKKASNFKSPLEVASEVLCQYCNKANHIASECRSLYRDFQVKSAYPVSYVDATNNPPKEVIANGPTISIRSRYDSSVKQKHKKIWHILNESQCKKCYFSFHKASNCRSRLCFNCGCVGHLAPSCEAPFKSCSTCESQEHWWKTCNIAQAANRQRWSSFTHRNISTRTTSQTSHSSTEDGTTRPKSRNHQSTHAKKSQQHSDIKYKISESRFSCLTDESDYTDISSSSEELPSKPLKQKTKVFKNKKFNKVKAKSLVVDKCKYVQDSFKHLKIEGSEPKVQLPAPIIKVNDYVCDVESIFNPISNTSKSEKTSVLNKCAYVGVSEVSNSTTNEFASIPVAKSKLYNHQYDIHIDTCAAVCMITEDLYNVFKQKNLVLAKHKPDITLYGVNSMATDLLGFCYLNLTIGNFNFSKIKVYIVLNKEVMTFTVGQNALIKFNSYSFEQKSANLLVFKCPDFDINIKMCLNLQSIKKDSLAYKIDQIQSIQESKTKDLELLISNIEMKIEHALQDLKLNNEEISSIKNEINNFGSDLQALKSSVKTSNNTEYFKDFNTFNSFLDTYHIEHDLNDSLDLQQNVLNNSVSTQTVSVKTRNKNKKKCNSEEYLEDFDSMVSPSDLFYIFNDPQSCDRDTTNAEKLGKNRIKNREKCGNVSNEIVQIKTVEEGLVESKPDFKYKNRDENQTALDVGRSVCGGSPRDDCQELDFLDTPHVFSNDFKLLKERFIVLFSYLILTASNPDQCEKVSHLVYMILNFMNIKGKLSDTEILDKLQVFYNQTLCDSEVNKFNFIVTVNNLLGCLSENYKKPS